MRVHTIKYKYYMYVPLDYITTPANIEANMLIYTECITEIYVFMVLSNFITSAIHVNASEPLLRLSDHLMCSIQYANGNDENHLGHMIGETLQRIPSSGWRSTDTTSHPRNANRKPKSHRQHVTITI